MLRVPGLSVRVLNFAVPFAVAAVPIRVPRSKNVTVSKFGIVANGDVTLAVSDESR